MSARVTTLAVGTCVAALGWPMSGYAQGGGGAAYVDPPVVRSVTCVAKAAPCPAPASLVRGAEVKLSGARLDQAARLVFEGRRGRADDATAVPTHRSAKHLEAVVPAGARSGPLAVTDAQGRRSTGGVRVRVEHPAPLDVAPASKFFFDGRRRPTFAFSAGQAGPAQVDVISQADGAIVASMTIDALPGQNTAVWNGLVDGKPAAAGSYAFRTAEAGVSLSPYAGSTDAFALYDHIFPIRGKHNLGYTTTNQFGGGRGHQGIDMFAECGVPLAAARGGRVQYAGYHGRAGNYVVIDGRGTGVDYSYMHMNATPLVRTGQRVFTGQQIGEVGDTGNADGCHLHFEMWKAPGWYQGGQPFDPKPSLAAWDSFS